MSGGVDSSVAACLLAEAGVEVVGVWMRLHDVADTYNEFRRSCCSLDAAEDARRVAGQLDIPFYVLNLEREFGRGVLEPFLQAYLAGNKESALQHSRRKAENGLWNLYPTTGKWVYVCERNEDDRYAAVCRALGEPAALRDPRFADAARRRTNNEALIAAIEAETLKHGHEELMKAFKAAGVVASPINNFADVVRDDQAWQNKYFMKAYCEEVEREVDIRGLPVTLSKTPGEVHSLGPQLGQDTEILMMELLGYEWEQIEALKAKGAIP